MCVLVDYYKNGRAIEGLVCIRVFVCIFRLLAIDNEYYGQV
jgi:hypothetical protein